MQVTDKLTITNEDNMALMARYPDNYFDLAIVDPPYLDDVSGLNVGMNRTFKYNEFKAPKQKYFKELIRVSKNQIIWGGNYFTDYLYMNRCWVCWDKVQSGNFSGFELAWTSFDKVSPIFKKCSKGGFLQKGLDKKIHPTQKPTSLYEFLLMNYAKENDKILDTHLGSGSIALACHNLGFELIACELDKEYYDASIKRIKDHVSQIRMF